MKELLHTPIFDVVKLDEVEAGFKPIGIKAPDWVSIIVEDGNGRFLLVEQLRYGIGSPTIEFPSGTVEKGEDPLDAAVRELAEETGLHIVDKDDVELIDVVSPNPAFMMNEKYVYYVDLKRADFRWEDQNLDEHEHIKFFWDHKLRVTQTFGKNRCIAAMFGTSLLSYWNHKGLFKKLGGMEECLM